MMGKSRDSLNTNLELGNLWTHCSHASTGFNYLWVWTRPPPYYSSTPRSASLMDQSHSETQRRSRPGAGGPYQGLFSHEITWRVRQQFLESRGYMLRRPGWTRSWLRTGTYWRPAEDSAPLPVSTNGHHECVLISIGQVRTRLVDATRIADSKLVYIKQVQTNDRVAYSVDAYLVWRSNHCVPILDTFVDSSDGSISYIVMPFLRSLEEPPFYVIGEILDFADQILEVSAVPWLSV